MERKNPEDEVARLLKELHNDIPSRFHPRLEDLRHEISRISTGVNVMKIWGTEPAVIEPWFSYGLQRMEAKVMIALKDAGPGGLSKEQMMARLYATQTKDWPEIKVLDVRMCKIRRKLVLAKAPWWIETIQGEAWILHEGNREPRIGRNGQTLWSTSRVIPSHHPRVRHNKAAVPSLKSAGKPRPAK